MREPLALPRPVDLALALVLLTRLPLPPLPATAFSNSARAVWAYPVAGLVVGGLAGALWWICSVMGLPDMITAALALACMVLLTGAMHEDGLADTADGLWGGATQDRRLEIMRDSRIGTYGVMALVLVTLLRYLCLAATGGMAMIAAATLSRAGMPVLMYALPPARSDGLSHSVGRPPLASVILGLAIAAVTIVFLTGGAGLLAGGIALAIVALLARAKLGGQTGDILGAAQQSTELAVLIALVAQAS